MRNNMFFWKSEFTKEKREKGYHDEACTCCDDGTVRFFHAAATSCTKCGRKLIPIRMD